MSNLPDELALVDAFTEITQTFESEGSPQAMLWAIARAAARTVPRCDHADVLVVQGGRVVEVASSDDEFDQADQLHQLAGEGPCVAAIREHQSLDIPDLTTDVRWPTFARRAVEGIGLRSMLSLRLLVEPRSHSALNLYSRELKAFDDNGHAKGAILAVHARLALTAARDRQTMEHMRSALDSNREIGMAMGILMALNKLTRDEAFCLLRGASQRMNIKLRHIASQVVVSGQLDEDHIRHLHR